MPKLCIDCNRSFQSAAALQQPLRDSSAHATFHCVECNRIFSSDNALRQHLRDSSMHAPSFACADCDQSSSSEDALRWHLGNSSVHVPYEGISPTQVKSVYKCALRLRRTKTTVQEIVRTSGTTLETSIVSAIWNAAERLNSLEEGPEQAQDRAEQHRRRSEMAQHAENAFLDKLCEQGFIFISEKQQRQQAVLLGLPVPPTPDAKFVPPVMVCGMLCNWLEFKDYFGFPDNPFVAQSGKRQFKKYVSALGAGAVVYSLGFQSKYSSIEGVRVLRAREVLWSIMHHSNH